MPTLSELSIVIAKALELSSIPVEVNVVNVPAAGVVPPTTPSNVPALISAVVATKEAIVPSEVIFVCAAVDNVPPIVVASTLPNEPVEVDEPLILVEPPPSYEPLMLAAVKVLISEAFEPSEPLTPAAVKVLIKEAFVPSEPLILLAI